MPKHKYAHYFVITFHRIINKKQGYFLLFDDLNAILDNNKIKKKEIQHGIYNLF